MSRIQVIILSLSIIIAAGCSNGHHDRANDDCKIINVDFSNKSDAGDFFDSWSYVMLESGENGEGILPERYSIDADENHLLFLAANHDLYLFDRSGKFINHINRRGQGPNEYIEATRAHLRGDSIWVLSCYPPGLYIYDFDGNFINKYPLDNMTGVQDFSLLDDGNALLANGVNFGKYGFNFCVWDLGSNSAKANFMPYDTGENSFIPGGFTPVLGHCNSMPMVSTLLNYSIYGLTDDYNLTPKYEFRFDTDFTLDDIGDINAMPIYDAMTQCSGKSIVNYLRRGQYDDRKVYQLFDLLEDCDGMLRMNTYMYRYDAASGSGKLVCLRANERFPLLTGVDGMFDSENYITVLQPAGLRCLRTRPVKSWSRGCRQIPIRLWCSTI